VVKMPPHHLKMPPYHRRKLRACLKAADDALKRPRPHDRVNIHVLCIGMGNWFRDAARMGKIFVDVFMYRSCYVHILNDDGGPTAKAVRDKIAWLKKSNMVGPRDMFVLYYSGHGVVHNNTFEFCTKGERLSQKDILDAVTSLGVKCAVYIIDACYAGAFDASKGATDTRTKGEGAASFTSDDIQTCFNDATEGTIVMAAASAKQKVSGSSLFTHLFDEAGRAIIREKILLKREGRGRSARTRMCVRPLSLFDKIEELRQAKFPTAPKPTINILNSVAHSFAIGPLLEVSDISYLQT